jgi:hypothetical protein
LVDADLFGVLDRVHTQQVRLLVRHDASTVEATTAGHLTMGVDLAAEDPGSDPDREPLTALPRRDLHQQRVPESIGGQCRIERILGGA